MRFEHVGDAIEARAASAAGLAGVFHFFLAARTRFDAAAHLFF